MYVNRQFSNVLIKWDLVKLHRVALGFYNDILSKLVFFFYWRYNPLWVCILQPSGGAIASSRKRFLDHTQRRATVGRTPLDE